MNTPGSDAAAEQQNSNLVDRLRRSELFRSYEKVFSEATSLPLALQPLEYWQLLHHGKKKREPVLRPACSTAGNSGRLLGSTRRNDPTQRRTSAHCHLSFWIN
jgi:hypothetical protein